MKTTMKRAGLVVSLAVGFLLCTSSCNKESVSPTDPSSPPVTNDGIIYGAVLDQATNLCVDGAVVEVLDGPQAGLRVTNVDLAGMDCGYHLYHLTAGTTISVRAFKDGYLPQLKTLTVVAGNRGLLTSFALQKQ